MNNLLKDYFNIRNPLITIGNITIQVIGDPHLGRVFRHGIAKNRLGYREEHQMDTFRSLLYTKADYVIIVGDLFDKFQINTTVFHSCITILTDAATIQSNKKFIILNGNHDLAKDSSIIGCFQLLDTFIKNNTYLSNIQVISTKCDDNLLLLEEEGIALGLYHYNPFLSIDQEIESITIDTNKYPIRIAFGHWETIDFGSDVFINRSVPTIISSNFNYIITGHEHKPKVTFKNGCTIITSGSMLPYAFGEELEVEPDYSINYKSLTVKELTNSLNEDYTNTCLRLLMTEEDEDIPQVECLSLTFKSVKSKIKEETKEEEHLSDVTSFSTSLFKFVLENKEQFKENEEFISELLSKFSSKEYTT